MIPRNVQITLMLLLVAILGSGIYILLLHRGTEESLRRASDPRPVAAPIAGANEILQLTIAYDEDGVFRTRNISAVSTETCPTYPFSNPLISSAVIRPYPTPTTF